MSFSYWEQKTWFSDIDFTVIGSGITGLNCALSLRERFPKAKIIILERGLLPNGASTKNAGFACVGSISEILDDLKSHTENEVLQLVEQRKNGLELLRKNLGDQNIGYKNYGGYEVFSKKVSVLYEACFQQMETINHLLKPLFGEAVFKETTTQFGFQQVYPKLIFNKFEGQIDTGKMMAALLKKTQSEGIFILNQITVRKFTEAGGQVEIFCDQCSFKTKKLLLATNGFSKELGIENVKPARAQVLITKPINNLKIKGTFHLEEGYYYFRNIDNRILLGGGRNLDFKGEETTKMEETEPIQNELKRILKETILPKTAHEIDFAWSGIMGVGTKKEPIVKQLSENVFCGVRLGGMGIAIGSFVGKELADLIE